MMGAIEVEVERKGGCLQSDYRSGGITFGHYLSYGTEFDDEEMLGALISVGSGGDGAISLRFTITDCIDDLFDCHRCWGASLFDEGMREPVASLRAELVAAIERLDAMSYIKDGEGPPPL